MVILIWVVTVLGLAGWSLMSWGLYRLLTLDPQALDRLPSLIERLPYADQIERWLPGWHDALHATIDVLQALLGWIGGFAPWLAGVVWAAGALALLGIAALLHVLVAVLRRPQAPPAQQPGG